MFVVKDSFLPPTQFKAMESSFPAMEKVKQGVRSHRDIHESDDTFEQLRRENYWWNVFSTEVHSRRWWYQVMSLMNREQEGDAPNPLALLSKKLNDIRFDSFYVEGRGGVEVHEELFLYGRMDVGYGKEGYGRDNGGRGIHIDMPQRIVSGLLYFTDQEEIEGGEFQVFGADGKTLERTIPIKKNRAILSFQGPGAYHAVNPVTKAPVPRRAIYFALSSSQPLWRT